MRFSGIFRRNVSRPQLLVGLALALLVVLLFTVTLGSVRIEGQSMGPTQSDHQYMIVSWAAYWFSDPQRGDVITFQHPLEPERDLMKRVIGLPGEWVEVTHDMVYIDGEPLEEPYVYGENHPAYPRTLIPEGHYFVLGDNRSRSTDSRSWGMLPRENIGGKAWLVYWPLSEWHIVRGYSYEIDRQ